MTLPESAEHTLINFVIRPIPLRLIVLALSSSKIKRIYINTIILISKKILIIPSSSTVSLSKADAYVQISISSALVAIKLTKNSLLLVPSSTINN